MISSLACGAFHGDPLTLTFVAAGRDGNAADRTEHGGVLPLLIEASC